MGTSAAVCADCAVAGGLCSAGSATQAGFRRRWKTGKRLDFLVITGQPTRSFTATNEPSSQEEDTNEPHEHRAHAGTDTDG